MNPAEIELIVLDVDGVLTDGRVTIGPDGELPKAFYARDGCAIKLWQRAGGVAAILSGRPSAAVERRAAELGIELVHTGVARKIAAYELILAASGKTDAATAYIGDDLPDLEPMRRCAFAVAVANAAHAVKREGQYVTRSPGGRGAVAEVIELILRKQKRWSAALLAEA